MTCPIDIAVTAHNGQAPTVSFDSPIPANGSPPITVTCAPASGGQFPNGATTVTCVATDSRAHTASCSFSVVVTPIPQISKTTFLAFGDSLTEGKLSLLFRGAVKLPPRDPPVFNTSVSYVEQLYARLATRYQDQTITIIAEGYGAIKAVEDTARERDELDQFKPDALLLLEGTNDMLNFPTSTGISNAAAALQDMVRQAKMRGVRVFLATLPQMIPTGSRTNPDSAAAVALLNAKIRSIAAAESVALVDLYGAVPAPYIGSDGVHLTPDGYGLMAEEWQKAIIETMEIKPSALQ